MNETKYMPEVVVALLVASIIGFMFGVAVTILVMR